MKTTHWLTAVQEKILEEIKRLPRSEQLREALLWRGFLAHQDDGRIRLVRIAEKTDAADIASLGLLAGVIVKTIEGGEWCAEIEWAHAQEGRGNAIRSILDLPSPIGMTSINKHDAFGWHFPAQELDLGVALLARGMMRLGLHTIISGHGSAERCMLYIEYENHSLGMEFRRRFYAQWVQQMPNSGGVTFTSEVFRGTKLVFGAETDDAEEAFARFRAAQVLGREIHNGLLGGLSLNPPALSLDEARRQVRQLLEE